MRFGNWICLGVVGLMPIAPPVWALGDEAAIDAVRAPWARWQGRVSLGTPALASNADAANRFSSSSRAGRVSAMGDYYFIRTPVGARGAGGFRATSGLAVGPRSQIFGGLTPSASGGVFNVDRRVFGQNSVVGGPFDAASETKTLSYIGIGYTGLSSRGGWSFSADLGLASMNPGSAIKLGRALGATSSADELAHDMRLSPLLQLGVSYSF